MSKPKIKLEVGQIWGVPPVEKTLEVRTIKESFPDSKYPHLSRVCYFDLGGKCHELRYPDFLCWVEQRKAVLIGRYDFKKGKAIAKGGKR